MSFLMARCPIERWIGRKMFARVLVFGMATLVALGAAEVVSVVIWMRLFPELLQADRFEIAPELPRTN